MQSKVRKEDSSSPTKIIGKRRKKKSAMKKVNQELEEQIEKLKYDKHSQDKMFDKIHNNNNLLEKK